MYEDLVTSFQLETSAVRGRLVRLRPVLEDILTRHQYPPLVNRQLSEMVAIGSALASHFKAEGIFTLQIHGDGPIHLMVVDVSGDGEIRACARFDEAKLPPPSETLPSVQQLFGSGSLVFAIEQGEENSKYQGVVELTAKTLVECMYHFFRQSEQISTGMVVFSKEYPSSVAQTGYIAGALFIQKLSTQGDPLDQDPLSSADSYDQDNWFRLLTLLGTLRAEEILEPESKSLEILYKLFWEDGVRIFENNPLTSKCRCSKERVLAMIRNFSEEDRRSMLIEEQVEVTCEFCSTHYPLSEMELFQEEEEEE